LQQMLKVRPKPWTLSSNWFHSWRNETPLGIAYPYHIPLQDRLQLICEVFNNYNKQLAPSSSNMSLMDHNLFRATYLQERGLNGTLTFWLLSCVWWSTVCGSV
jgi:hypothetical protein